MWCDCNVYIVSWFKYWVNIFKSLFLFTRYLSCKNFKVQFFSFFFNIKLLSRQSVEDLRIKANFFYRDLFTNIYKAAAVVTQIIRHYYWYYKYYCFLCLLLFFNDSVFIVPISLLGLLPEMKETFLLMKCSCQQMYYE